MREQLPKLPLEVARIASAQHGVVTYGELRDAGLSRAMIGRWVQKGLLHRVHRGVYRFGHSAPSIEATYLAAVKACGEGAVLSGRAAARVYGLIKGTRPPPEVIILADRRRPGITIHLVRDIDARDATTYRGIRITTVPRTLVDLAATLSLDALSHACHQAEVRYHVTPATVEAAMARRGCVRGAQNLRAIIHGDHHLLLSRLEREFLAFLREETLPLPKTNRRKGRHYVDCRWAEQRLTVELDSFTFHHSRHAWEQDRQRERAARARGDEFRRYTWRDVMEDRTHLRRDLRTLLPVGISAETPQAPATARPAAAASRAR